MSLTTAELSQNILTQLEASLAQDLPFLPRTFSHVLAKALAGVFILLYKYVNAGTLQYFVQTASARDTEVNGKTINPLTFWGRLLGAGDPTGATQAEMTLDVTVTNPTGTLPQFTQLVNADNGITYLTTAAVALNTSPISVTVRASADQAGGNGAGAQGNLQPGAQLNFVNAQPNIGPTATVTTQVITGANAENSEIYRQRVLDYFQKRPQGGAPADYELWGEEVAGIVNVYVYKSGTYPNQVDLYCEATPASSGSADGFPTTAQLEAVRDATQLNVNGKATRRPLGALVNTYSILREAYSAQVVNLQVDDPVTVQADIATALTAYFARREPWVEGLSVPPRADRITQSAVAGVVEDVVSAAGGTFDSLILTLDGATVGAQTLDVGTKAKLGTVAYL